MTMIRGNEEERSKSHSFCCFFLFAFLAFSFLLAFPSKSYTHCSSAKLQWLQDPGEINGDNLNNIRREASKHFMNKKKAYLKDKINELATNSKNKNVRDLYRGIKAVP
jgi:hypothetical protein